MASPDNCRSIRRRARHSRQFGLAACIRYPTQRYRKACTDWDRSRTPERYHSPPNHNNKMAIKDQELKIYDFFIFSIISWDQEPSRWRDIREDQDQKLARLVKILLRKITKIWKDQKVKTFGSKLFF